MFGGNREQIRGFFLQVWRRRVAGEPLEPLERMVAEAIAQHPEYHPLFTQGEEALQRDWLPEGGEGNPFLHLGMHITLLEQIGSDRPAGITPLYQRLVQRLGDPHLAEHRMMECLGAALWEAQRAGRAPDEAAYLACIGRLATDAGKGRGTV
jgi:hypothetical protein